MKKKIFSLILVLIVPVFLFCGCKEKSFEGEICHLEYKEAYTQTIIVPVAVYNGTTTTFIYVPYIRTYPDRWYVEVRNFNTEKQEYEYNDCYVTEECFNQLKIGDWFVYDSDYCFEKEPYTQVKE